MTRFLLLALALLLGLTAVGDAQTTTSTTTLPAVGRTGSFVLNRGTSVWGRWPVLVATGAPTSYVECGGAVQTFAFGYNVQGTATVIMEWSIDEGTTWYTVTDSSASATGGKTVGNPSNIRYRPNVTACTSCAVSVTWRCTAGS